MIPESILLFIEIRLKSFSPDIHGVHGVSAALSVQADVDVCSRTE